VPKTKEAKEERNRCGKGKKKKEERSWRNSRSFLHLPLFFFQTPVLVMAKGYLFN